MSKDKKKDKELANLMDVEFTGINYGSATMRPSQLRIYQNGSQDKHFGDGRPSGDDFGKLFIQPGGDVKVSINTLKKQVEGTVMSYDIGFIINEKPEGNEAFGDYVGSGYGVIGNGQNSVMTPEEFEIIYPNCEYRNEAKMVLALGDPEKVIQDIQLGINPFVEVTFKKTSYGLTFSMPDKFNNELKNNEELYELARKQVELKGSKNIPACAYTAKIGTKEQSSPNGIYYTFTVDLGSNNIETTQNYIPIFKKINEVTGYGNLNQEIQEAKKDLDS